MPCLEEMGEEYGRGDAAGVSDARFDDLRDDPAPGRAWSAIIVNRVPIARRDHRPRVLDEPEKGVLLLREVTIVRESSTARYLNLNGFIDEFLGGKIGNAIPSGDCFDLFKLELLYLKN